MARFVILMYHMVAEPLTDSEKKYACPPRRFAAHMRFLRTKGYPVVSLDTVQRYLNREEEAPPFSVAVTLDDGFRDNYESALPVLREQGIPATIFLASGMIGKTNEWMQGRGFPRRDILSWSQIDEMKACGITFGAHTVSHPRLNELSDDDASWQIGESRRVVEERLGRSVDYFAYPYGLYSDATREIVQRSGYALACSTRSGFNTCDTDPFLLRRIEVFGTDPVWKLKQKITYGSNEAGLLLPVRYYWSRIKERLV